MSAALASTDVQHVTRKMKSFCGVNDGGNTIEGKSLDNNGRAALAGAVRLGSILLTIVAAGWAGALAMAFARRIWTGEALGIDLLISVPLDLEDLVIIPIMAGVLLIERLAHGADHFPLKGLFDRTRYDLFFVLADASGALKAFALAFSFGVSALIGTIIWDVPALRMPGEISFWAQVPAIYVVMTFVMYWMHRFMHSPLMWPLHALHHAAEEMTALTDTRQHPLDDFIQTAPIMLAIAVLGFHPDAVFLAILFSRTQAAICHSQVPFPLWLERWLLCGPALHRIHHSVAPEHHSRNFSALVLWDRLFGTFALVPGARTLPTGVGDARYHTGRPMHDMIAIAAVWLAGLSAAFHRFAGWAQGAPGVLRPRP
jgi:sterol desaturase/sphingolipid hydroxylase (fatty acid hydroxylase superfamily)